MDSSLGKKSNGFGTAPVFFTAISTILGAILFLRFGYAVGTLGFLGTLTIIIIGHLVTIPTALSISEIATNQKVEGGGEYFIISRSFGLNIGATIGIALFFSQAISVAFYVIAFTEAFEFFFDWFATRFDIILPRQVISIPAMTALAILILKKGANMGVKTLYVVVGILFISLLCFFLGKTDYSQTSHINILDNSFRNSKEFFTVFAIIFPAFTGMTAGVGLSGDLKRPGKSIPLGTTLATVIGMIIYVFIAHKLVVSASQTDLVGNQLVMGQIALFGLVIVPLGLAASTISSAIGSIMVAPRTLQALAADRSFPLKKFNRLMAKGKGKSNEPFNASIVTILIAFIFVALGNVNAVAEIISMFFMVTYGSLNLISFLNHFGADPAYRPSFRSRPFLSLIGFLMSVYLMFKINTLYALAAIILMMLIYAAFNYYHKDRQGLQKIFKGVLFQLSRKIHIYLQKARKAEGKDTWRPSAICVSTDSFQREEAFDLLNWISYKYGFGTFIHLIEGYYSKANQLKAKDQLEVLIEKGNRKKGNIFIDTIISPSYTSAIAQIIQLPGISGMENNMILFEFDKENTSNLEQITENFNLTRAAGYDICILGSSRKNINFKNGIHIWIRSSDHENANLMILLSYILLGHPDWRKGMIKIFDICKEEELKETRQKLLDLVQTGRLPISTKNIEIIKKDINVSTRSVICEKSKEAGLTLIGFRSEQLKHDGIQLFTGYESIGDVLFVNADDQKEIT
ncbi:amino acid permease [candidate division KSB1 bacterium]